jgi:hypothetical protein
MLTFLEYARPIDLENAGIILVLLVKAHVCGLVAPYGSNIKRGRERQWNKVLLALTSGCGRVAEDTLRFSDFNVLAARCFVI